MEVLCMVKYLKFSWKEQNNISRKSLIGISLDQDTGYLKIRWLDRSALPATEEILSYVKYYIENEMGRLKEKYLPSHIHRTVEKYGTSGCFDIFIIEFPYKYDEFEDFGYVSGKIHVSMYRRLNETIIYEGNVWNFIILLERLLQILKADESFEITNLEVKEFTPWGESLRKIRNKQIEQINENYEYEKF